MMNQKVYELLREVTLDVDNNASQRAKALDALLEAARVEYLHTVAVAAKATVAARDVPTHIGARLAGMTHINAIKKLRELMPQFGLKEAKDRVEAMEREGRITLTRF